MRDGDEVVPGQILVGTYEVQRLLGRGAMGAVYCVRHIRTGGHLALKMLNRDLATDPEMYRRFEEEAHIISGLNHPNIVKLTDWNIDAQARPFLVMEYLDGEDLQLRLNQTRTLGVSRVLEIAQQIGGALQAAHDSDIVHRDVKPQNIFLVANRTGLGSLNLCKLLDFGVCKTRRSQSQATQNLTFVGTPEYMSPEAARGTNDELDGRSDQFSLAVVIYQALTGVSPFAGGDPVTILYRIVYEPAPALAERCAAPPGMVRAIERALSKDKERRFGSMRDFVQALLKTDLAPNIVTEQGDLLAGGSGTATLVLRTDSQPAVAETSPPSQSSISGAAVEPRPRRPRLAELSIGMLMVVALAGAALLRWHGRSAPEPRASLSATTVQPATVQVPPILSQSARTDVEDFIPKRPEPTEPASSVPPAGPREPAPPRKKPLAPAAAPALPGLKPRAVRSPVQPGYPPFPLNKTDKAGIKEVLAFVRGENSPAGARDRYGRAFESYRKGDSWAAIDMLQSTYNESRDPSLLISIGHAALQNLQCSTAVRVYDKYRRLMRSLSPALVAQTAQARNMAVRIGKGMELLQRRLFCKAAETFGADDARETLPQVNVSLGQALQGCGRLEEAKAAYAKFLKAEPGAPESLRRFVSRALDELKRNAPR